MVEGVILSDDFLTCVHPSSSTAFNSAGSQPPFTYIHVWTAASLFCPQAVVHRCPPHRCPSLLWILIHALVAGMPFNQLGTLAGSKFYNVEATYYYLRWWDVETRLSFPQADLVWTQRMSDLQSLVCPVYLTFIVQCFERGLNICIYFHFITSYWVWGVCLLAALQSGDLFIPSWLKA